MTTRKITFDPDSGTPYSVNLTINTGATFSANFRVVNVSDSPYNFEGWTGSSQMAKSVSIGSTSYAAATFNVGFTSAAGGKFSLSLDSNSTRSLVEGRYIYDILVSSGSTVYRIVDGNILVKPGISSAP
jgi:hypothetical protein